MVDIKKISTESRNERTKNIDLIHTIDILKLINDEDKTVAVAVEKSLEQIEKVVDVATGVLSKGGRLIYIGAGTSGRLGVLDASECPPTFGVSPDTFIGIIAGGDRALRFSVEGVEDLQDEAVNDLKTYRLTKNDMVIGIAASGRTPYVIAGVQYAKEIGAKTGCITTSANSELSTIVQYPIEAVTGAEPLTGSTRMKSGTAQKMVLNMISTATMVKLGKVYENLMVDVQMSNDKLVSRAQSIVSEITGVTEKDAAIYLEKYQSVKYAVFAIMSKIEDLDEIKRILDKSNGNIRTSLGKSTKK